MASRSFSDFIEHELGKFPHFLIYALLEWIMIIMLLIDGFLAFISNEFAKFFELRIPCLLCTRIDHILVHKNYEFYYDESICEGHKKDISSLAYCHVHGKLSDIRGLCEGCLLSFVTEKESDTDTYKSLVGILHKDGNSSIAEDPKMYMKSVKDDDVMQFQRSYINRCSCCGDPLKMKPNKGVSRSFSLSNANIQSINKASIQSMNNGNAHSMSNPNGIQSTLPTPSPRAPVVTWKTGDGKIVELPQIKLVSDSELDVQDDEDGLNAFNQQFREEIKAATLPLISDCIDMNEEIVKTPSFKGNKFFGVPLSDFSPRWSNRVPRNMQLEKSDLFTESNDANIEKNSSSETIVQRLKRQVRLDRKCLIALYMELDEERNAAAVAANNAMAMITRLQAEKSAVQTEALQYQRMMEEQAEYDQEEIQILKDTVLKSEHEIKLLEADLDIYRDRFGNLSKVGSEECEVDAEDYQEMKSQSVSSFSEKSEIGESHFEHNLNSERQGENGGEIPDVSHLDFANERSYLMTVVANLEKKISTVLNEETHPSEPDMVDDDEHEEEKGNVNKATLTREMSLIRERLRSIEADSGFLKHSAMTMQKGSEGTKLLTEIAEHLRKLRQLSKENETVDT